MSATWIVILVGIAGIIGWIVIAELRIRGRMTVAKGWPVTTGTVVHSSVSWTTRRDFGQRTTSTYHFPVVRYSYSVGGQDYQGDRLCFGSVETAIAEKAEKMRSPFPEGTIVEVRYNPQNPHESILAAMVR